MRPETEYAEIAGLRIAYQTVGEGPPDVLLSAGHFNHTDAAWEEPSAALFLRRMAGFCRLIRFDALGTGGSDRPMNTDLIPAYDDQIGAVLDAAGSDQVEPGDIMVSRAVRDLTAGSPVGFEHAGAYRLKGLAEEWDLFRVKP